MSNIDLRAYVFLDSLQAQYAAFLGTVAQGFLPLRGDASLTVEVSPGIEINRLTDIALKSTKVKPGMQIIERYYGMLEIHAPEQAEVRAAGAAILAACGLTEADRIKPRVLSSQIIRRIDDHQAQLVNRMRHGEMLIPGETLYVLELEAGGLRRPGRQRGGEGGPHQHPRGALLRLDGSRLPRRRGAGHRRRLARRAGLDRRTRRTGGKGVGHREVGRPRRGQGENRWQKRSE